MRSPRLLAIIATFLIVATSIPPALLSQPAPSQPSQPKQSATRERQRGQQQRSDALAPAINELLKQIPLPPISEDDKDSVSLEEKTPPADNASIKELIDYWSRRSLVNGQGPSETVRQRMLEAVEDRPDLIFSLISLLPENTDTHDRLYKLLINDDMPDNGSWRTFLKNWLQSTSRYFRDELIAAARGESAMDYSSNHSLARLAQVDWEAARPIMEAFVSAGDVKIAPVALTMLYERAQQDGDSEQVEKLRALLKAIVVNRHAPPDARTVALSSVARAEWSGSEDWVVSLFADPTLSGLEKEPDDGASKQTSKEKPERASVEESVEEGPNILSSLLEANSERWLPVIMKLVGHNQRIVHRSAVSCLVSGASSLELDKNKEIARKLAPWLTDPNWAGAKDRPQFIQLLVGMTEPELAPGLIWVIEHDEDQYNRVLAADALARHHDPRAIPGLRRALEKEENEHLRGRLVFALAECGGFSHDEMAEAIVAYAKMAVTEEGELKIYEAMNAPPRKPSPLPIPLKISIGRTLSDGESIKSSEGLAVRLIGLAKSLRYSHPSAARLILRFVEGASPRVAEINLVERIGAGWADADALKLALANRDSLHESAEDELRGLIKQGGYAAGIAAVIMNDERQQIETLVGMDLKAQLALIAGARYLRYKLPVELVGKLLDSPNRDLAKAAESYLEVEDSADARKLVLARHRGEAYIIGYSPMTGFNGSGGWEEALRKDIKSHKGLEAIYAMAQLRSREEISGIIIRVYEGRAEISIQEVEGRRHIRALTESEIEELKSSTSRPEIENLGPELGARIYNQGANQYLRLTKDGGRRILLGALRRTPKNPTLHEELSGLFHHLIQSGEFVTRYDIEDKIPGVEVLLADKKQDAMMVCGEGSEIRILIGERTPEDNSAPSEATPEWRVFSSGAPGAVTDPPSVCRVFSVNGTLAPHYRNNLPDHFTHAAQAGGALFYTSYGDDAGIWKLEPGAEPAKILSGVYTLPVVTPDGKWLVATKTTREAEEPLSQLIRHNLETGKEFLVNMANAGQRWPITYVAALGKVLISGPRPDGGENQSETAYLLAPETGTVQQIKGEFDPLREDVAREMQPTENPGEFWAAIYHSEKGSSSIGRYDSRNFAFTPVVELPRMRLNRADFWVDAATGKIWLTYHGHLLRIPLPKK